METLNLINNLIALLFAVCFFHQLVYIPIQLFKKRPLPSPAPLHRYAILICARNEENVIGQLLDSIRAQSYPQDKLMVFVMADNCTDRTAETAWMAGAEVYQRFSTTHIGKGYALEELLQRIGRDYGDIFDGYFVFDADNLLREDYIEQMNRCFHSGIPSSADRTGRYEILTSFRNAKNYGDNWISAGYAQWFMRESTFLNSPRSLAGTSCAVSGTGFLFSRRILHKIGRWHFHLLTEDIEFTIQQIIDGETIGYCPDAVLYDEQPTRFSQSWRQRMRWAKGYLQVFCQYGARMIRGIFRGSFACWDMCMANIPAVVLNLASLAVNGTLTVLHLQAGRPLLSALAPLFASLLGMYISFFLFGLLTLLAEWKQIHTTPAKKILYTFTFPLFMFTYIPISFAALFTRVTWKPIEHHARPMPAAVGKRA